MNERIIELAIQAGACWNHGDFNMGYSVEFQEGDLEKFAELIVKECISVMKSTVDESIDIDRKLGETYYWVKSDIKNHFGVEE